MILNFIFILAGKLYFTPPFCHVNEEVNENIQVKYKAFRSVVLTGLSQLQFYCSPINRYSCLHVTKIDLNLPMLNRN